MTRPDAEPPNEAALEAFFRHRVRLVGGHTIKLAPTERGVPDRLVMMPGGRLYLVELKTPDGALSPIQKLWHERMRTRFGIRVHVLHGRAGVLAWLRRVVSLDEPGQPRRRTRRSMEVSEL